MDSFFEKLKKGMGTTEKPVLEDDESKDSSLPSLAKASLLKEEEAKTSLAIQTETTEKEDPKEPEKKKGRRWFSFGVGKGDKSSFSPFSAARVEEGQLTIDVYQTENDLVIQTAVAGVKPEDLDVSIERDIVTIRGGREKQYQEKGDYFIQECFWGKFSRQIILPAEVDPSRAKASFREGILTIRMPKIKREKKMKINISA